MARTLIGLDPVSGDWAAAKVREEGGVLLVSPAGSYPSQEDDVVSSQALSWADAALVTTPDGFDITRPDFPSLDNLIEVWNPCPGSALTVKAYALRSALAGSLTGQYRAILRAWFGVPAATVSVVDTCEATTNNIVSANVTCATDSDAADFRVGSNSLLFTFAAGAADEALGGRQISSTSFGAYQCVRLWIKSSVGTTAGQLQLLLSTGGTNEAGLIAGIVEEIDIPALTAATFAQVFLPLENPHSDTAILSWAIRQKEDLGAMTVHVDDINAIAPGSWSVPVRHLFGAGGARILATNDTAITTDAVYGVNAFSAYVRVTPV